MLDKLSCIHPIPITIIGGPIGKWVIWCPNWKSALAWSLWTPRVLLIVMAGWTNSYNHLTNHRICFFLTRCAGGGAMKKGARKCSVDLIFKSLDILQLYHYCNALWSSVEIHCIPSRQSKSLSQLTFYQHNSRKWEKVSVRLKLTS